MRRLPFLLLPLLTACGGSSRSGDPSGRALEAYAAGDFERAEREIRQGSHDLLSLRLLGRIHLFRNRLSEASDALRRALQIDKTDLVAVQDLAAVYYRQDDFASAAAVYKLLGEEVLHAKYASLAQAIPYAVRWEEAPSVVSFAALDPVPMLRLRVNGVKGLFVLDTGAGEIVLDDGFAKKARAKGVGVRVENFAGPLEEGTVDEVTVGSVTARNIPVRIRRLQPIGRQEIDGLLGVNFLLHFAFSIDYRRSRLILHRMDDFVPAAGTELSYFVVGDRFLVVPGKVDGHSTYLFVHTGMAQVPIAPSQGVLWTLSNGNPDQYKLKSAEFGPVTIQAPVFDSRPFPVGLDTNFGFTIGAALGHEAFRGRILAFDPVRMRMRIE